MSVLSYVTTRFFGLRHYGALYGRLYGFANLGIAAGILAMGFAHDLSGDYVPMRLLLLASLALSIIVFASLPPYAFPRAGEK